MIYTRMRLLKELTLKYCEKSNSYEIVGNFNFTSTNSL